MRGQQSPNVVKGKDVGDQVFEIKLVFEDAHQYRNLQADQQAGQAHQAIQQGLKCFYVLKEDEKDGSTKSSDESDQELDADESRNQIGFDVLGEERANPHGKEIDPDDDGKLGHRITQEVTGEGTCYQFIDQAAGGNDKYRYEEQVFQVGYSCQNQPWAKAMMMESPSIIAPNTMARAVFCFSTISFQRLKGVILS